MVAVISSALGNSIDQGSGTALVSSNYHDDSDEHYVNFEDFQDGDYDDDDDDDFDICQ